jgi:hypothetical protein
MSTDLVPVYPWDSEPDEEAFLHADLPCLIKRGPLGNLNGYVAVPPWHPLHGKHYDHLVRPLPEALENRAPESYGVISLFCASVKTDDITKACPLELAIAVHGGLTFAAGPADWMPPLPNPWWFGFDCSHAGDIIPDLAKRGWAAEGVYRDIAYVREQVKGLAEQLVKYSQPETVL